MKIVTLISLVEQGGAQMAILRLTQALRDKGHDVQAWGMYLHRNNTELRFDRILLPAKPGKAGYLKLAWKLTGQLRNHKPDAVISFLPLANTMGLLAATLAGVPRRVASQRGLREYSSGPMRVLDRILGSTPVYHANIAVSQAVVDSFACCSRRYRAKMTVVRNCVIPQPVRCDRQAMRARLGVPADAFLVVCTGRLSPEKNHATLINAIKPLPDVHLLIAGDGPLHDTLHAMAGDPQLAGRLHLPGPLPHQDIASLLAAGDGYALPSLLEGMSNALLEAMQMGLPLLASDLPSQQEVLIDRQGRPAGVLLPATDTQAWTAALDRLARDDAWRRELSALAVARSGDFSLETMVKGFEAALGLASQERPVDG